MTNNINENAIEQLAINLFKAQGFEYKYGPDIAPYREYGSLADPTTPERESFYQVLLTDRLNNALARINPTISAEGIKSALQELDRLNSSNLLSSNEVFHRLLTEGINISVQKKGLTRGDYVYLVDFENIENNNFLVVNQFSVIENNHSRRFDIVLFVNGLPLIILELKNPFDEQATIENAYKQIQTYKNNIPSMFLYNGFCIISDGLVARAGTLSSEFSRFMAWKSIDGSREDSFKDAQMNTLIKGMLNKQVLLDMLRHFIVFESSKKEDAQGMSVIQKNKKLAAYHQYYAVNRAVHSTLRASGYINSTHTSKLEVAESPEPYGFVGVKRQPINDRKGGVVWHTQGSGKSLTMVFYVGKIVLALDNPTVVVITDRNDLDDQLFHTFAASRQLLRQEPVQAENREHLKDLLKVNSGGIVFTTIQKFQPEEGNVFDTLSERKNIIVIVDEAHRTQYGFAAKTRDEKDEQGNLVGQKVVYGFAKYLRDALPHATYLAFTGTPIESKDINTQMVFGNYVDVYDIRMAVEDGATVKIFYESRLAKISLSEEGKQLVKEFDDELAEEDLSESQEAKLKWTKLEALIGSKNRVQQITSDIVSHFEERQKVFDGKAMIVAMSRRIAAEFYKEIIALKPEWHSNDIRKGQIKVIITSAASDGPEMSAHNTTKEQRRILADRMKDPDDELKLVIVRDMWLTGFDVPSLTTLYLDKPMKGHTLMQAIARVNRVYKDKAGGLVVDYLGIASDLKNALSFYSDSGAKGDPAETQEQAVEMMQEKLEIVSQMFFGFDYKRYFKASVADKLSIILAAQEHVLSLENGKKRFVDQVTALSQVFAVAIPHPQALEVKDEVAFFLAVKARLVKLEFRTSGRTDQELETAIRQVIDQALVSEKVIDVFDAAGIKRPDISILSEEFLLEVKNLQHKNVALELLKKLLNNEISSRMNINYIESKSLMEMLEKSIKNYHNKIISAVEVIEELIGIAKEIKAMDKRPEEMGLKTYEYSFYAAVANNESAKELMGKDQLRELAVALYYKVKENATIDWTKKESTRAKLKIAVKRTLNKYGYPPDMEALAIDLVLEQATRIADELPRE